MIDIISRKRDGYSLTKQQIEFFVNGYTSGEIPDYQASALLMAIMFKSMNYDETTWLTLAMADSGDKLDLSEIVGIKVDKHSTGGVGDKTTLICAPIVAACGVPVAKMSGRGLGHTGGTLDKLESIPGFQTSISSRDFINNICISGICIAGQTGHIAPADKKLYALRDVTATIESIPLIASSIMSKKIAMGANAIVLDVKVGKGAFMKDYNSATDLAETLIKIGKMLGRKTIAIISDMNEPLGYAIGNSIEVIEAIETLKGNGPSDLLEVSLTLASLMLELGGIGSRNDMLGMCRDAIKSGKALDKFETMIKLQGGNSDVITNYSTFGTAKNVYHYTAESSGIVTALDSLHIGQAACLLGAGRENKDSIIDLTAGIRLIKKIGDTVVKGEILAEIHTKLDDIENVLLELNNAWTILSLDEHKTNEKNPSMAHKILKIIE